MLTFTRKGRFVTLENRNGGWGENRVYFEVNSK